jgi:RNA polymerase sigma factor (sigma-70 family)
MTASSGSARGPGIGRETDRKAARCLKDPALSAAPPYHRASALVGRAMNRCNREERDGVSLGVMDEGRPDDVLLAARLASDLDGSFESLVLAHQDRLFTIALRTRGDRGDAEELVQDTFVRAYRALGAWPPARIRELRVRGWLTTILLNAGRNRARVKRVRTTELAFDPATEPTADAVAGRESRETWARLLAELTAAQRTAVVLRHVDGLSYAEIAEAVGRPEGTVKAHVHRGLAALRKALLAAERREREEIPA